MSENNSGLKPGVVEALSKVLDAEQILDDLESCKTYGSDWTIHGQAGVVVRPRTTEDVSNIMKVCHKLGQPVVPSAGRTGLAGGAVSQVGEVAISCELMTSLEPVDAVARTIVVQPGVITSDLQRVAEEAGLYFAIDLGAKESSRIGGNIATNVGGLKLVRYGGMREQILGLEVVLPDGEVLDLNRELYKDNTGYKLQQLFIGSEGTLGYITKACIRLWSLPPALRLACLRLSDLSAAAKVIERLNQSNLEVYAVEYFDSQCLKIVKKVTPEVRIPGEDHGTYGQHYLLIEVDDQCQQFEPLLMTAYDEDLVKDIVIGDSPADQRDLWQLRELISESISVECQVYKNDISIPIGSMIPFLERIESTLDAKKPYLEKTNIEILCFGHLGDGNLHLNYTCQKNIDSKDFKNAVKDLESIILSLVRDFRGSISAEHGIGILKKDHLNMTCSAAELKWMKRIKKLFDPNNIMNPGKIFEVREKNQERPP